MCIFDASQGWYGLQSCTNIPSKNSPEILESCETRIFDPLLRNSGRRGLESLALTSLLRETSFSLLTLLFDSCDATLFLISARHEEGFAFSARQPYTEIGRVPGLSYVDLAQTESCRVALT